jgi:RNA polymerase sigma factor (sigma-70 family)
MKFEEFHPQLEEMVITIASEYGAKGRRYGADHEDFRQEFMVWLLAHQKGVGQRMALNPDDAMNYVGKSLRNRGKDHLRALRAQSGRDVDDAYLYTRDEVKALLPIAFEPDHWHEFPRSVSEAEWVASLTDVQKAYDTLALEDRDLLAMFHREGWTNKMMAQAAGISEALMSYLHNRALTRLLKLLGNPEIDVRNPWHGRRAVSNAAARARQSQTYTSGGPE